MFRFVSFIKFLTVATNQHGVHSPFVYNYITKCLYAKERLSTRKSENVLLKTMGYFNVSSVLITDISVQKVVKAKYPHLKYTDELVDFAYLPEPNPSLLYAIKQHNNTIVFIDNIYRTKEASALWDQIKNLDSVTVTVDLFYSALVFFRKEQAKEHFSIRT